MKRAPWAFLGEGTGGCRRRELPPRKSNKRGLGTGIGVLEGALQRTLQLYAVGEVFIRYMKARWMNAGSPCF